jgi:hypothetical protein
MKSIEYPSSAFVQGWMQWLHDGLGTTLTAFGATLFYGAPLVVLLMATGPLDPARLSAPLVMEDPPGRESRVVGFLALPEAEEPAEDPSEAPPEELEEPSPEPPSLQPAQQPAGEGTEAGAPATRLAAKGRPVAAKPGGPKVVRQPRAGGGGGSRSKRNKACAEPHPHIRTGADGVLEIDRSLVDEYTKNLEAFMSLGYSRPYDENGVRGWYISGFSCTSPVQKAGFRRGDVLVRVNGKPTRSWVGVYLLYQKLKNKQEFEVELIRKGEPVKLQFRVVG